ncbi:MAG TPA: hypothetical protein VHC96_00480 [Puia sp.]|nr:hypothetical protein [Puia sp.]
MKILITYLVKAIIVFFITLNSFVRTFQATDRIKPAKVCEPVMPYIIGFFIYKLHLSRPITGACYFIMSGAGDMNGHMAFWF